VSPTPQNSVQMNGAIAELCAKIRIPPSSKRATIIGSIYQSFRSQKNAISSAAIPSLV
jgi:hypothetical protein